MHSSGYELVTQRDRLAAVAERLAAAPAIAVDTEFVRRTTFYAKPGLLQLSAGDAEYLVDLVAIEDCSPLAALFLAPHPLKVMHACGEDLEVLRRLFGGLPGSLFDTQVAAALLGHPLQTSYQKLVKAILAVDVPKDETRSDWTARPLTDAQLSYAALDVRYLLVVWQRLTASLAAQGRYSWLEEDCARLLRDAARDPTAADAWRGVANAWRLAPAQRATLAALAAWREHVAREQDKPRSHVLPDNVMWLVAQRQPQNQSQLRVIPDLHPAALRRFGDEVLRVVREARDAPPPPSLSPPLPREAKSVLGSLRNEAETAAKEAGLEIEVLVRRRHLEAIVEGVRAGEHRLPDMLSGWRRALVGDRLLQAAERHAGEIRAWPREVTDG